MNSTEEINAYLKRLKNGEKCLEEFFCAVSGYIKFIAYRYLVDKSFIHDVVSITFYKVLDNIQKFDENLSGKAWISKIAQNEAYSINDRERRHSYVPLDEVSEEVACTTDYTINLELAEAFETVLSKLDETDREIVELRVYGDMTYEEIANALNMHVSTVYKRYIKCLNQINKEIL